MYTICSLFAICSFSTEGSGRAGRFPQGGTIRATAVAGFGAVQYGHRVGFREFQPEKNATNRLAMLCALCAALISSNAALAQQMNADDLKWINECIRDNRDEPGGTPAIIRAYCVCMNEKMDDNETRSITQWEKANPRARRDCERQAGWK